MTVVCWQTVADSHVRSSQRPSCQSINRSKKLNNFTVSLNGCFRISSCRKKYEEQSRLHAGNEPGNSKCLICSLIQSQSEFQSLTTIFQVERQIQMQNQMRERMVAMQIARSREMLNWFGSFYALTAIGMFTGYKKSQKPGILVPLLPLSFILAYQIDLAYGSKLHRIRGIVMIKFNLAGRPCLQIIFLGEAENIINYESELLELPCSLPTLSTIDQARQIRNDQLKMHCASPPLYY